MIVGIPHKKTSSTFICKIDPKDHDLFISMKWHIVKGYAYGYNYEKGKKTIPILLHRVVAKIEGGRSSGKCVDHINRNRLDNRFSNLRIVSYSENSSNCSDESKQKRRDNALKGSIAAAKIKHNAIQTAARSANAKKLNEKRWGFKAP